MELSSVKTCDLVRELMLRDGVDCKVAEPHKDVTVNVNGPAIILTVID